MPLNPATISAIVGIGIKIYEFIDKVTAKGQHGDPLKPLVQQLDQIRNDIANLGQEFQKVIGEEVDQVLDELRVTQLAKLPVAQAAIADYLRTHPNPKTPEPPQRDDPNYVQARGVTLEVKTYFQRPQLEYMGGFFHAMNARVEFMTATDACWWRNNPEYIDELRQAVNHASGYVGYIKAGIDRQFRVSEQEKTHIEHEEPQGPPFNKPKPIKVVDSITFSVNAAGQVFWSKTVPPAQRTATRIAAQNARTQFSGAKQKEIMGHFDNTIARWNTLVASATSASIQRALLPRTTATPLQLTTNTLEVTALRQIEPKRQSRSASGHDEATENQPPQYELPLRDVLIKVLQSGEFQQRQERSLRSDNGRLVNFWFQKAFHRDPTPDEAATLAGVMKLFGHKSFFSCLGYSREYEERYGEGLPDLEPVAEPAEA